MPPSPCYGSHRRPLRAPPFAARASGGVLSPLPYGWVRHKREIRGAVQRYVPPLHPLAPAHSNRTWVWGSPLSPPRICTEGGATVSATTPSPSFPLTRASETPPLPQPLRRLRAERVQGWAAAWETWRGTARAPLPRALLPPRSPPALPVRKARARLGGGGGCAAMGRVRSLVGTPPPSVLHPALCANGECRAQRYALASLSPPAPLMSKRTERRARRRRSRPRLCINGGLFRVPTGHRHGRGTTPLRPAHPSERNTRLGGGPPPGDGTAPLRTLPARANRVRRRRRAFEQGPGVQ